MESLVILSQNIPKTVHLRYTKYFSIAVQPSSAKVVLPRFKAISVRCKVVIFRRCSCGIAKDEKIIYLYIQQIMVKWKDSTSEWILERSMKDGYSRSTLSAFGSWRPDKMSLPSSEGPVTMFDSLSSYIYYK